jgi:putative holliday junction resolvase
VRVVALDHGAARCGVAVSDPSGTLATPLEAIERPDTRRGLTRVVAVVEECGAERVVVGLPVSLSGADSDQTRAVRAFAERLAARVAVPVDLYDERFTTRIAERSGPEQPRTSEDSRAAAVLLEDYLRSQGPGVETR